METNEAICAWANEAFGPAVTRLSIARRAAEEMDELIAALEEDDRHPKAPEEAADIIIVLARLFEEFGTTEQAEIDRKMTVNRMRKWRQTGTGHGYHIKENA